MPAGIITDPGVTETVITGIRFAFFLIACAVSFYCGWQAKAWKSKKGKPDDPDKPLWKNGEPV